MLSRWPIRSKLLLCIGLLFLILAGLSFGSFRGVYSYRRLARSISQRARELPLSGDLTNSINQLQAVVEKNPADQPGNNDRLPSDRQIEKSFQVQHQVAMQALVQYRNQLLIANADGNMLGDTKPELQIVKQIEDSLDRLAEVSSGTMWMTSSGKVDLLHGELHTLNQLANNLPAHLQQRMNQFAGQVRVQYRTLIVLTWISSILAAIALYQVIRLFNKWLLRPFQVLITGSRRVAAGDFDHRIELDTHDEVSELAGAMNDMTSNFQQIHDELDQQVKQRTREVVRSEQLASVGFLAAGVAHEINNPLASIAWCAESLESRLPEMGSNQQASLETSEQEVLGTYLRRIQDEAFRCKEITNRLLDFSRIGEVERQATHLGEVVADVVDMVQHLGKYRNRKVLYEGNSDVIAMVNSQEMKQVVLNLIINALDSLETGGIVWIDLGRQGRQAVLTVRDNGCGMTEEVLEHLFEPFFTRRRDGHGTGLGLSITYRIVTDHGGQIIAESPGEGKGSVLKILLPIAEEGHGKTRRAQVA